jgi:hypothetical protein
MTNIVFSNGDRAMAKKTATKKRTTRKVNKSKAITDYLADHPEASTAEVVVGLKEKKISVTRTYVSNIKSKLKSEDTVKPKRGRKAAPKDTSPVDDVKHAGELMFQAVDLVLKAGVKEAKSMVEMAGKMVDRIKEK